MDAKNLEDDEVALNMLCAAVAPQPLPKAGAEALRERLLARVGASRAETAGLSLVRRRAASWSDVKAGVRAKKLWQDSEGSSVLLELAPGAGLPMHRHAQREEGLILAGGLHIGGVDLGVGDYQTAPAGSRHGRIHSDEGCLAFLRGTSLGSRGALIAELVGGLWPGSGAATLTVRAGDGTWTEVAPGVEQKLLARVGVVVSRLLRLRPGASLTGSLVPGVGDCLMIEGDAYFGDLLVCAGDFMHGAAGVRPGTLATDGGALCFLCGPLPAA